MQYNTCLSLPNRLDYQLELCQFGISQQSCDVSSILRHALRVLEKRGIVKVTLRSDNAGYFYSTNCKQPR